MSNIVTGLFASVKSGRGEAAAKESFLRLEYLIHKITRDKREVYKPGIDFNIRFSF